MLKKRIDNFTLMLKEEAEGWRPPPGLGTDLLSLFHPPK